MQSLPIRRSFVVLLCALVLAACARNDDPPILQVSLRSVTLASADPAIGTRLQAAGYQPVTFAANYPGTTRMHALMWEVPESVVEKALEFSAPGKVPSHVRVLAIHIPPDSSPIEGDVMLFYRQVLGAELAGYPVAEKFPGEVSVRAWTYSIPNVLEADRLLREHNIPVVVSPVGLMSPIFGDHKSLAIRSPNGDLIELIETTAN